MINLKILKFLNCEQECSKKKNCQDQIKASFLCRKAFGKLKSTIKKPTEVGSIAIYKSD
jgi:hypothetical protein